MKLLLCMNANSGELFLIWNEFSSVCKGCIKNLHSSYTFIFLTEITFFIRKSSLLVRLSLALQHDVSKQHLFQSHFFIRALSFLAKKSEKAEFSDLLSSIPVALSLLAVKPTLLTKNLFWYKSQKTLTLMDF